MVDPAADHRRSSTAEYAAASGILTSLISILVPAVVLARDNPKGARPLRRSLYELRLLHFIEHTWNGPIALIGSILLGTIVGVVVYFVVVLLRKHRHAP